MFKALIGENEVEIDVLEIADKIDDILHKELTRKTGITVDHYAIARFVISIINENNAKEEKFTKLIKDVEKALQEKEERLKNK
ncbi:MAG: hypothetical protein WC788_03705 [Candidatus Paceibacterota bacterium]|jgi:16S rRNA C1402 (ribose-2'-O) methylase RsmI